MNNVLLSIITLLVVASSALAQDSSEQASDYFSNEIGGRAGIMPPLMTTLFEYRYFWSRKFSTDAAFWAMPLGGQFGATFWPMDEAGFQASVGSVRYRDYVLDAPTFEPELSFAMMMLMKMKMSGGSSSRLSFVIAWGVVWHIDQDYIANGGFRTCDDCIPGQPPPPWVPDYRVETITTARIEIGLALGF